MAFFFFFYIFWKNIQRCTLANFKKKGIKVKNSRMGPRIQRKGKGIDVNLKFSAAFDFETLPDFQVALDQKVKRKVLSQKF